MSNIAYFPLCRPAHHCTAKMHMIALAGTFLQFLFLVICVRFKDIRGMRDMCRCITLRRQHGELKSACRCFAQQL